LRGLAGLVGDFFGTNCLDCLRDFKRRSEWYSLIVKCCSCYWFYYISLWHQTCFISLGLLWH